MRAGQAEARDGALSTGRCELGPSNTQQVKAVIKAQMRRADRRPCRPECSVQHADRGDPEGQGQVSAWPASSLLSPAEVLPGQLTQCQAAPVTAAAWNG